MERRGFLRLLGVAPLAGPVLARLAVEAPRVYRYTWRDGPLSLSSVETVRRVGANLDQYSRVVRTHAGRVVERVTWLVYRGETVEGSTVRSMAR